MRRLKQQNWRLSKGGSSSGGSGRGGAAGGGGGQQQERSPSPSANRPPATQDDFNSLAERVVREQSRVDFVTIAQLRENGVPESSLNDFVRGAIRSDRWQPVRDSDSLRYGGNSNEQITSMRQQAERLGLGSAMGGDPIVGIRLRRN